MRAKKPLLAAMARELVSAEGGNAASTNTRTAPEVRYRLVIEGDIALMRQIGEAVELQGRIHLGQFDEIFREIDAAVHENATADGYPIYGEYVLGSEEKKIAAERFMEMMNLQQRLKSAWIIANREWETSFRRKDMALYALSPHSSRRENRAYTLWKWMEHFFLHLHAKDSQDFADPGRAERIRHTVHYDTPTLVASDMKVQLMVIEKEG